MEIKNILSSQDYSYRDKTKTNKTSIAIVKDNLTAREADQIIDSVSDLIDDERFKPFFYKKLYTNGRQWFIEQAYRARKPYINQPSKFFVHLMR